MQSHVKYNKMYTRLLLLAAAIAAAASLTGCSDKPDAPTAAHSPKQRAKTDSLQYVLTRLRKCSRLYSTEYHVHKVVTHADRLRLRGKVLGKEYDKEMPLGERKVAIPIDATVKAYVDLAQLTEQSVLRDSNTITITLPDPVITLTSSRIDHDDIQDYVPVTRRRFSDEELADYEAQGRKSIMDDMAKSDILESARRSAAMTIIPMLVQAGYEERHITVTFRNGLNHDDLTRLTITKTLEHAKEHH